MLKILEISRGSVGTASLRRFNEEIARDFFFLPLIISFLPAIYAISSVLHVIQIVSKECVMIFFFTQPNKSGVYMVRNFLIEKEDFSL